MIAIVPCLIWLFLLFLWGGFWRSDQRLKAPSMPTNWPDVTILIPARDEAETISQVVHSHMASSYPGRTRLIVIDGNSTDKTGEIARQAGASVVKGTRLLEGWSGKLWALNVGLRYADETSPEAEYLLLTDADIQHAPDTLRKLVAKARNDDLDLTSLMARLDARGIWGTLLIPVFVFFFQKLYPFRWVNDPAMPLAAAAGGCVLMRREALRRIGDFDEIRDALIDDCTLAARIKRTGGKIWLGLADTEVESLRDNRSFGSIWTMVRRTAFTQLRHSWILLALAVSGMGYIYLGPIAFPLAGISNLDLQFITAGVCGWLLMSIAYWPTLSLYRKPVSLAGTLPIAAALYTAMTLASALSHLRGKGGAWKGRTYP